MFKRMLSAFGVGGPSVDTVLDSPHVYPGQAVTGQVRVQGGSARAEIDRIVLSLITRVEVEHGDHEGVGTGELLRVVVADRLVIPENQRVDVPFRVELPWEAPITAVSGSPLPRMSVGLRTELVIAGAPDKGDLDPVEVHPLPSQDRVLDAFGALGFQFSSADVEAGVLHGVPQQLGFFQEIEFYPPREAAGRINQVELTFVATPHELYVVLEADKRGGLFRSGGDAFGHFRMTHQEAERTDWTPIVGDWLTQVAGRGGHSAFGHHQDHGYHQDHGHYGDPHRRGPGMGGIVGGAAAGIVGGMVLGEVFEEVFDDE
ncbi:sporulation protein [Actinokineospora spheciospongiae]|uniref:sporulation protein n=1 Tax=Actinokineospora spheciospongiae TaxID=909613 RepID=UPI000D714319|nr:sporulation protein [Actinokineospora spheciospongiae]PWW51471.1 sporulation-control protein [Actinokineospora spheciospongiae]